MADLSQPEHFAIHFLPIIMIASSFLMQKMTPMAGGDPNQQKIMQFMPLMWGFFFWSPSSGLVLYWLTSNLVQIAQQWFFNKTALPVLATAERQRKQFRPKTAGSGIESQVFGSETGPRIEQFLGQVIAEPASVSPSPSNPAITAIRISRIPI